MTIVTNTHTNVKPAAYAAWLKREQRRQETYTAAWAMTVASVEVKRPAKPVCRWSEQTFSEYVKRDRMRAINWPSV